ncbi:MAG: tRNA methyltransferase [Sulfolobaceae archaeon]|nr:tRNA methyltransferase [Sulfolobaceae archaeon]
MRLKEILCRELKERGITEIFVGNLKKKYGKSYMQTLAVKMLIEGLTVVKSTVKGKKIGEECGIELYAKGDEKVVSYTVERSNKGLIELDPPKYPFFLIDFSLWDRMLEDEKKSLLLQFILSLNVIRSYLWDKNLGIYNAPDDFFKMFNSFQRGLKHSLTIVNKLEFSGVKAIVLNPYGNIDANEQLLKESEVFILGGVVDKGRRIREATTELSKISGYYDLPQVRIALKGSIVGVPDRLNSIIEIIMKVREDCSSLEEAIISSQSNADKLRRIYYEISRGNRDVEGLVNWLRAKNLLSKLSKNFQSNSS